jgi:hypothetical protein
MADITDPGAVLFCNKLVRPLADAVAQVYGSISLFPNLWESKGMATLIPNDPTANVIDGSATDGRTPITGADANAMLALANALLAMATGANGQMGTVLKVAVNPG